MSNWPHARRGAAHDALLIQKHPGTEASAPVRMLVVRVRHVGMRMLQRFVPVSMAMFTRRHGIVNVVVMPVVVAVGVFVLQRIVGVLVSV